MFDKWIAASGGQLLMILVSAVTVYAAILVYTRIVGLRSFSKMSAADFAMTIATGSLFGSTISAPSPTLFMGLFAILCIFVGQAVLAWMRLRSATFTSLIDNRPLLLMAGKNILQDNLRRANMTEQDLFSKLREANALKFDQVKAVVFETTGDISVLHTDDETEIEPRILEDVIGSESLFRSRDQTTANENHNPTISNRIE